MILKDRHELQTPPSSLALSLHFPCMDLSKWFYSNSSCVALSFLLLYAALYSSKSRSVRSNLALSPTSLLFPILFEWQWAHTFPMRLNYLTFTIKINVLLLEIQLTASGEAKAACGESIPNHFCLLLKYFDKRFTQETYKIGKFANILRWFVMSISLPCSNLKISILCKNIL